MDVQKHRLLFALFSETHTHTANLARPRRRTQLLLRHLTHSPLTPSSSSTSSSSSIVSSVGSLLQPLPHTFSLTQNTHICTAKVEQGERERETHACTIQFLPLLPPSCFFFFFLLRGGCWNLTVMSIVSEQHTHTHTITCNVNPAHFANKMIPCETPTEETSKVQKLRRTHFC